MDPRKLPNVGDYGKQDFLGPKVQDQRGVRLTSTESAVVSEPGVRANCDLWFSGPITSGWENAIVRLYAMTAGQGVELARVVLGEARLTVRGGLATGIVASARGRACGRWEATVQAQGAPPTSVGRFWLQGWGQEGGAPTDQSQGTITENFAGRWQSTSTPARDLVVGDNPIPENVGVPGVRYVVTGATLSSTDAALRTVELVEVLGAVRTRLEVYRISAGTNPTIADARTFSGEIRAQRGASLLWNLDGLGGGVAVTARLGSFRE